MKFTFAAFADEASAHLSEQITALRENHIPYLEIRGVDGENVSALTPQKAKEVRARLDANGISVWSVGSPFGKIKLSDDFAPHLDLFKRGIETAHILGATRIRMFSFYTPAEQTAAHTEEVFSRLSAFCDAAEGSGVVLCHENEKGIYGDIPARCVEIHRTFPSIRAVFDPANFVQCGVDTKEAWDLLAPYVDYLHIKDSTADGTVVPAGAGIGNIPYLLSRYQGSVLTLEPHLAVFDGLAALEAGEKTKLGNYTYPTNRAAFDAAVSALNALLQENGGTQQ